MTYCYSSRSKPSYNSGTPLSYTEPPDRRDPPSKFIQIAYLGKKNLCFISLKNTFSFLNPRQGCSGKKDYTPHQKKKKKKAKKKHKKGSIYYSVSGANSAWLFSALRGHPGELIAEWPLIKKPFSWRYFSSLPLEPSNQSHALVYHIPA